MELRLAPGAEPTGRHTSTGRSAPREGFLGGRPRAVLVGIASGLVLTGIASADGGYFPTSWNWSTILFGWLAVCLLILRRHVALSLAEVAFFGLLASYSAWIWLSALWSIDAPDSILAGQRVLVYVVGAAVLLLAVDPSDVETFLGGWLVAFVVPCFFGLITRLFPDRAGMFEPLAGYRLAIPLGYWNAEGIYAALGTLLAFGLALRARSPLARAAAAGALFVLLPALQFTFSRGAWLALAVALVLLVASDPRRLQVVVGLAALAPALGAAIVLCWRSHALTSRSATVGEATSQGHRLALMLLVLALVDGTIAALLGGRLSRWHPSGNVRRAGAATVLAVAVVGSLGLAVRFGSPASLVRHGWESFAANPSRSGPDLDNRLLQFSSNGRLDLWRAALDEMRSGPIAGRGAGTFEVWWNEYRGEAQQVRNAHSLYLETLGGLGIIGLTLIVSTLAVVFVGGWTARRSRYGPFLLAMMLAFTTHAALDWDWEMPAVTLAGIVAAVALLRSQETDRPIRLAASARLAGAALLTVVVSFAILALAGNVLLSRAQAALTSGNLALAEQDARRSASLAGWSAEPLIIVAGIESATARRAEARRTYLHALELEPRNDVAWFGLANVSTGALRRRAAAEVVRLNPLSSEAKDVQQFLGKDSPADPPAASSRVAVRKPGARRYWIRTG
jgi:O-antigen ligase